MGGQECITGHLRSHVAIAQDEVGQDGEHCTTRGALEPPDGEPTEPDPGVMGVAGQAPASLTGRLVFQLQAKGEEKGEHTFDKRLAITKQLKVGGFVLEIDGDRPVFAGLTGSGSPEFTLTSSRLVSG